MSSTLAGNLTVVGSVANLIVIQQAAARVKIGFWEYFRVGAPLGVITILIGAAWLGWRGY
jgi:Na+/H+ antiporter NhaD/arsenite permease-like protein